MRTWHVAHRSAKFYPTCGVVRIEEHKAWALAATWLVGSLDALVGHHWCSPPDWTFKVPFSAKRDDEGALKHTLGDLLFSSFQKAMAIEDFGSKVRGEFDVDQDWLKANGHWDEWMEALEQRIWDSWS